MGTFREDLERTLRFVEDLPTLPAIALGLERVLQDEAAGAAEAAIVDAFSNMGRMLDHEQFWKHSFSVAVVARAVIEVSKKPFPFDPDEGYVAGLLHDVGLLVLDQYFPDVFSEIQSVVDAHGTPRVEAEREVIQLDHGQVGAYLLRMWGLPGCLIEAVAWHHQPELARAEGYALAAAAHVAESAAGGLEPEQRGENSTEAASDSAWQELGLSPSDLPDILETVEAQSHSFITCLL